MMFQNCLNTQENDGRTVGTKAKDPDPWRYQKYLLHVSSCMLFACPRTLEGGVGDVSAHPCHTAAGSIWTFDCL